MASNGKMTKTDFELIKTVFGDDPADRSATRTPLGGTAGMAFSKKQKRDFIVEHKRKPRKTAIK
jgi:hypothetical protein